MGLLEKPVPKRVLLLATISSILVIFVLMSNALAPKLEVPSQIISGVAVVESSGVHDWKQLSLRNRFLLERAVHQIAELGPYLKEIGGYVHPVELEIDSVNPLRFEVSSERLVVGTDILQAQGQLQRSLLKIWVLQNADPSAIPSTLRYEVAADLLTAFYHGRLRLEDPITHQHIEFPSMTDGATGSEWTDLLLPLDRFCKTPWRPLELLSLCQMMKDAPGFMATPMMARPLIGALVWRSYQKLSMRDRPTFIHAFADALKSADSTSPLATDSALPRLPTEWRIFIEHEARLLTPRDSAPASRLPQVGRLTILRTDSRLTFIPNGLGLHKADLSTPSLRPLKALIWESCQQPKISDLLDSSSTAKRILYVHNCDPKNTIDYGIYEREGLESFAAKYPKLSFVALHEESLRLAQQKGLTDQLDLIGWVLNSDHLSNATSAKVAALYFGLAKPQWHREIGAYQVDGAIEAVEWFRP